MYFSFKKSTKRNWGLAQGPQTLAAESMNRQKRAERRRRLCVSKVLTILQSEASFATERRKCADYESRR